ncbi:hypothetical protein V8C42DRAFT_60026 [Trichoderma barbatum]
MSHPTSHNIVGFDLTPIEQNGLRRYTRVAIVLPLRLSGSNFDLETTMIQEKVLKALFDTIAVWPILGGSVIVPKDRDGKLTMRADGPQSNVLCGTLPGDNGSGIDVLIPQLCSNSLGADFFPSERFWNLDSGMPPVRIKLTFFGNLVVLGFSFYEAVVDNEFISCFFTYFSDVTWLTTPGIGAWLTRWPLQALPPAQVSRNMFSFYNWINEPLPHSTSSDNLVCRLIDFEKYVAQGFIRRIRRAVDGSPYGVGVNGKDYIVAFLWAAIMHARFMKGRITALSTARLNILLPGEPHARRAEQPERNWGYFGSSTVPTVAEANTTRLLFSPNGPSTGLQDGIMCDYSITGIAEGASAIRKAINKVDYNYVQHLMGLKDVTPPIDDWEAYERGIDRHTTGTVFEDWSGYFDDQLFGLPHTTGQPMRLLPCADDKEEGKIVLLPRLGGRDAANNEIGWSAWVCLERDEMDFVLAQLDAHGGFTGGRAAVDLNTARSS